jgi:hypothetical protein
MNAKQRVKVLFTSDTLLLVVCLLMVPTSFTSVMVFGLFDKNIVVLIGVWLASCSFLLSVAHDAAKKVAAAEGDKDQLTIEFEMIVIAALLWTATAVLTLGACSLVWPAMSHQMLPLFGLALTIVVTISTFSWLKARAELG